MSATVYGPDNLGFGNTAEADKGYYISDLSVDASVDEAFLPDHIGDEIAVALFNEKCAMSGNGFMVTKDDPFHQLSAVLSINSTSLYGSTKLGAGTAFTQFYCNGLNLRNVNREFQQGGFSAFSRVGLTDAVATVLN